VFRPIAAGSVFGEEASPPGTSLSEMPRGYAARWAIVGSLPVTAKLNNIEPFAYLQDLLGRTARPQIARQWWLAFLIPPQRRARLQPA
jgi:hypothetical protein